MNDTCWHLHYSNLFYVGGSPDSSYLTWRGDFLMLATYNHALNASVVSSLYLEGPHLYHTLNDTCGPSNIPCKIRSFTDYWLQIVIHPHSYNLNVSQSICMDFLANSLNSDGTPLFLQSAIAAHGTLSDTDSICDNYFVPLLTEQGLYLKMQAGTIDLIEMIWYLLQLEHYSSSTSAQHYFSNLGVIFQWQKVHYQGAEGTGNWS